MWNQMLSTQSLKGSGNKSECHIGRGKNCKIRNFAKQTLHSRSITVKQCCHSLNHKFWTVLKLTDANNRYSLFQQWTIEVFPLSPCSSKFPQRQVESLSSFCALKRKRRELYFNVQLHPHAHHHVLWSQLCKLNLQFRSRWCSRSVTSQQDGLRPFGVWLGSVWVLQLPPTLVLAELAEGVSVSIGFLSMWSCK